MCLQSEYTVTKEEVKNMKNLMTKEDIAGEYEEMVKKYMAEGTIFPWQNGGSQGEIAKIEFRMNDGSIVRVRLESSEEQFGEKIWHTARAIKLIAEKFEYDPRMNNTFGATIWNGKGELLEEKTFFQVDRYHETVYATAEQYRQIHDKQMERYEAKKTSSEYEVKVARKVILKALRNHKGYKSKKADIIEACYHDSKTGKYTVKIANSWQRIALN